MNKINEIKNIKDNQSNLNQKNKNKTFCVSEDFANNRKRIMEKKLKIYDSLSEDEEKIKFSHNIYLSPHSLTKFILDMLVLLVCIYNIILLPIRLI